MAISLTTGTIGSPVDGAQRALLVAIEGAVTAFGAPWVVQSAVGSLTYDNVISGDPFQFSSSADRQLTLRLDSAFGGVSCRFSLVSQRNYATIAGSRPRMSGFPHDGFAANTEWFNQTGGYTVADRDCSWSVPDSASPALAYWIVVSDSAGFGEAIYVILRMETGLYQHFGFGRLNMLAAYTAGDGAGFFMDGTIRLEDKSSTFCDFDNLSVSATSPPRFFGNMFLGLSGADQAGGLTGSGFVRNRLGTWHRLNPNTAPLAMETASGGLALTSFNRGASNLFPAGIAPNTDWQTSPTNIVSALSPSKVFVPHSTITGKSAVLGQFPGVYQLGNLNIANEAVVFVGADQYTIFPASKTKSAVHLHQNSGLAIRVS